jgi:diketogulonate reductase-like aldo/keto reductase
MGQEQKEIIPPLGFGTWKLHGTAARQAVETALSVGYRYIDTADVYQNHYEVAKAIKSCRIPRSDIFLTTKLWTDELSHNRVYDALLRFLEELSVDYLDLLLIHWPNKLVPIHQTLEAMAKCQREGLVRHLGVSNFTSKHLDEALQTGISIITNQIELHPTFNQSVLHSYCQQRGIVVTAYSPIAQGREVGLPLITQLAQKYEATPSQIILSWHRQIGNIAIPRSSTTTHIQENWDSQKIDLSLADIAAINSLPQGPRLLNPSFAEFEN